MSTFATLADDMRESWAKELDPETQRRRKAQAREEARLDRELPGRAVTHRFMRKYQHHVAGTFGPCIRAWGDKHTEMCDALERFRTRGQKEKR